MVCEESVDLLSKKRSQCANVFEDRRCDTPKKNFGLQPDKLLHLLCILRKRRKFHKISPKYHGKAPEKGRRDADRQWPHLWKGSDASGYRGPAARDIVCLATEHRKGFGGAFRAIPMADEFTDCKVPGRCAPVLPDPNFLANTTLYDHLFSPRSMAVFSLRLGLVVKHLPCHQTPV